MKLVKISALLCVLTLSSLLFSQTAGSIAGTVTDSTGAVVQGATVTATNQATNAARSADTNSSGAYSITNLAPGVYSVVMEKAGFKTIRFDATALSVAQALVLNAQFTIGSVQEILQVNGGETAPIETETSQLSTLVDSKTMNDLPLLTRNAYELVLLSPGVIQPNNGSFGFAVNGSRDRQNNFLLDGVDNNDTSVPGAGSGVLGINPDSAQEFRVITRKAIRESLVALPVDLHSRAQRKESGATREASVDPDFIGKKDETVARQFLDLEIESIGQEDLCR